MELCKYKFIYANNITDRCEFTNLNCDNNFEYFNYYNTYFCLLNENLLPMVLLIVKIL